MNKELTPLEALKKVKKFKDDCCMFGSSDIEIDKDLDIIETALKREDSIEITAIDIEQENQALCKENKKLKRVLEIIKEKRVNVHQLLYYIMCDTENEMGLNWYNQNIDYYDYKLTQEEWDLLKEFLND